MLATFGSRNDTRDYGVPLATPADEARCPARALVESREAHTVVPGLLNVALMTLDETPTMDPRSARRARKAGSLRGAPGEDRAIVPTGIGDTDDGPGERRNSRE